MPISRTNSGRFAKLMLSGASLLGLAIGAASCSTIGTSDVKPADHDYRLRHPILVSNEPEEFRVPVGMRGPVISPEIEVALRDYVHEYGQDGTGSITIQVPTGSANAVAAATTGHALHYALVRAGVPSGRIEVAPYEVGDHSLTAPLRLTYLRVKAVVPHCGIWPDTDPNRFDNAQYHNFGCASQQNLAAMVADPADFVRPKPMSPINGGRRANVIKIYIDTGNTGWQPVPRTDLSRDTDVGF
jgi:pilus assembly protein CpaD